MPFPCGFAPSECSPTTILFASARNLPGAGAHTSQQRGRCQWTQRRQQKGAPLQANGGETESGTDYPGVPQFTQDWRAFRAQLVARERALDEQPSTSAHVKSGRWVHELSAPEVGCLLVARYEDMGIFSKTVILLLAHDDTEGTVGLILNRPTPLKLDGTPVEPSWMKDVLGDERLYLGGPLDLNKVNVVHGCGSLAGAREIVKGVYHGGELNPDIELTPGKGDVHVFMGYAAWGAHQLAAELHDNSWWVLAASKEVILGATSGMDRYDQEYYIQYWQDVVELGGLKHKL